MSVWRLLIPLSLCGLSACQSTAPPAEPAPAERTAATVPVPAARGAATAQALVDARVEAIRRHDRSAYDAAMHPAVRATITPENRFFYDDIAEREVALDIKDEVVTHLDPVTEVPDAAEFSFAVQPTMLARVSFIDPTPPRTVLLNWQLADSASGWYVVMPTPTASGLEALREKRRLQAEARSVAEQRIAEMDPRVRAELEKLLSTQRTTAAARIYRRHAGVSMAEARMVVELLYDRMDPAKIDPDPYD